MEKKPGIGDTQPDRSALYMNREVSWLLFNERVLGEAVDGGWPLLERVKFLAIHGSNLDEFFMIRVSGLHEQLDAQVTERAPDGLSTKEQLTRIRRIVSSQLETVAALFKSDIVPALAKERIFIHDWALLTPAMRELAGEYFHQYVFPVLTPLAVDPGHPFPFLSHLSLSLAVEVRDPVSGTRKFARVKVPESLPRFVAVGPSNAAPAGHAEVGAPEAEVSHLVALEQLIAAHLDQLFPGMEILAHFPFRVTRDMDVEILEEEAHDLLSVVDREIRKRRFGACVRLEVDATTPERIRRLLLEKLEIDEDDLYETSGPLGHASLMGLLLIPRPDLRDPPLSPRVPSELLEQIDAFAAIQRGDIVLHHPYDSFTPVLDFLNQAADDPHVLAIKMTLYRAGSNAEAVRALVRAAENGKQVAASIELKARFDEENNIGWARKLERAGVHVFFGAAASKTHAKATLVVRREGQELVRYVHLSTGNYNATTARLYTDFGLLTADPEIGRDVSELFNSLSGFSRARYKTLAVAPVGLRDAILSKIDEQAARARAGQPARIFAKLNSLVDEKTIFALYEAATAGVAIELVVRGICCLRPGIAGVSDNIRVSSVLGRFLEHERVYAFGPEGEEQVFLSSADWMPRNFDRRVEVLFPIRAAHARERILREAVVAPALEQRRLYDLDAQGRYQRRPSEPTPHQEPPMRPRKTDAPRESAPSPRPASHSAAETA